MSDNEKRSKPKYEAPTIVALGGLAKGSGACVAGVSDAVDCTAGTAALNACTDAGVAAIVACTAGESAVTTTCSAGSFKV